MPHEAMTQSSSIARRTLEARDLRIDFMRRGQLTQVLRGVNLSVTQGEVLCLLGESGSGKSLTLRAMLGVLPGQPVVRGQVLLDGADLRTLSGAQLSSLRGKVISMVFQEPLSALDPVFTVGHQISEKIVRHEGVSWKQAEAQARQLMERVQIPAAGQRMKSYPHELSGGMRQRAMIALALACRPDFLLADEPTTALDVTVQIQVLLLLKELQRELGMGIIFVTHDIGVAAEISDRLAVMYAGQVVEAGATEDVLLRPSHPYTEALLASTVHAGMRGKPMQVIGGTPPDPATPVSGCAFGPRCRYGTGRCADADIPMLSHAGREVRCLSPLQPMMRADHVRT